MCWQPGGDRAQQPFKPSNAEMEFTQLAEACCVRKDLTTRERQEHETVIDFTDTRPEGKLQVNNRQSWLFDVI